MSERNDHRLDIETIKNNLLLRAIGQSDQMTAGTLGELRRSQEEIASRTNNPVMREAITRMTSWGEQQIIAGNQESVREFRAQLTPRELFPNSRQQETRTKLSPFRRAVSAAWRTITGILPHRQ